MRRGFTLIELLIVIGIIALLAGLLFPVFARAKDAAKQSADLSNLSQLGKAMFLYAADDDDSTPTWNEWAYLVTAGSGGTAGQSTPDRVWDSKLVPYVRQGNAPVDATQLSRPGVWHSPDGEQSTAYRSYGINQMFVFAWIPTSTGGFDPTAYAWRYGQFSLTAEPSRTILLGDGGQEGRISPPTNWDGFSDFYVKKLGYYRREAPWRYNGRAGYVFSDGHAKALLGDVVYPSPHSIPSPSQALGQGHCAMATWFCPTLDEQQFHRTIALRDYNVTCR